MSAPPMYHHPLFGDRLADQAEIVRVLARTTRVLDELLEAIYEWFDENEWPVVDGYVDAPSHVWHSFMVQCDVRDAKALLAALAAGSPEEGHVGVAVSDSQETQ